MNMISSAEAVCLVDLERLLPFVDLVKMESRKQKLLRNLDEVILESRVVGCWMHVATSYFCQVLRWMFNVGCLMLDVVVECT